MISFLPWEPDKGPFSGTSTDSAMNVAPVSNGWGPLKTLSAISASLGAQCYGATYYRASNGDFGMIAGTKTGLFRYNTAVSAWTDVSGPSAPYSVPDGQMWQFERFGTGLYATNIENPVQVYDVDAGGTFSDVAGNPPKAKYIRAIGDFLLLAYLKIGAQEYPTTWKNSGLNDASFWTTGKRGCDEQVLPDGDEIVGIMDSIGGGRIFQRRAKRALIFSPGSQFTFQMQIIDASRGAVAPLAIVPLGGNHYFYLNEDGFYMDDDHKAIGAERVDAYFFADVDLDKLEEVQAVADPYNKMVWVRYQDNAGTYKMIGYDWQLDRWCRSEIAAQVLVSGVSAGYTLDGMDIFGALDSQPAVSLDSRFWKGGRPTFGAFTSDNMLSLFTGANAAATIETASIELIPGSRAFLNGARLVSDATNYTMQVAAANFHGGAEALGNTVSPSAITGMTPFRSSGRLHRFRANIAAGATWSHAHGVDVEGHVLPEGQR